MIRHKFNWQTALQEALLSKYLVVVRERLSERVEVVEVANLEFVSNRSDAALLALLAALVVAIGSHVHYVRHAHLVGLEHDAKRMVVGHQQSVLNSA